MSSSHSSCRGYSRVISESDREQAIAWCQRQQRAALEHMKEGHKCDNPHCFPLGVRHWLEDSFLEELFLMERPEA
jgi:hypothetical protein